MGKNRTKAGKGFFGLTLVATLILTLMPTSGTGGEKVHFFCVLCNIYTVPDAIARLPDILANILLFLPLGIALGIRSNRLLFSVIFGAFFSLAIEITQFVVPGRFPSLQDIILNTVGTFIGFHIAHSRIALPLMSALVWCKRGWEQCKRPPSKLADRLAFGAAFMTTGVFALTTWLLTPAFPDGPYLLAGKEVDDGGATPVRIGAASDVTGHFQGSIDEVRIYNRALSPREIKADMETPVGTVPTRPASGLVAAYSFDEESGDRIPDISGQESHGLLRGAIYSTGKFGKALLFNGHGDQVIIPYASVLELKRAFTLEAWVKPEVSDSPWPAVIQKGGDQYFLYSGAYMATLVPNGGGTFGGANEGVAAPKPIVPGVWSHLATTYDGSVIRIYVNGHLEASLVRWFQGYINEMFIGSTQVQPGFVDTSWLKNALQEGETIRLHGIAGSAMAEEAALLSIQNRRHVKILRLAAHADNLVLRYFTVAAALGFPSPEIRFHGALQAIKSKSPLDIEVSGIAGERSLAVNGTEYRGFGFSLGMGWTVLVYSQYLPLWLRETLNLVWISAWAFLTGFWAQSRVSLLGTIVILGGSILILPTIGILVPTPAGQWIAAGFGFLLGSGIRFKIRGTGLKLGSVRFGPSH